MQYKDGSLETVNIGEVYTSNSSHAFYVNQDIVLNNFKVGEKFRRGDILAYNKNFFTPDPYSKQVNWNIGVIANIALLDNGNTIEDASMISEPLSELMRFQPIYTKDIVITRSTNIHKMAFPGNSVLSTEPLMVFDESALPADLENSEDNELIAMLEDLNRATPKAEHTGEVVKVDIFYKCQISAMSKSLATITRALSKDSNARAAFSKDTRNNGDYPEVAPLVDSDRVGNIDLTEDTVVLRFYIRQNKPVRPGDKVFYDSSLKSVVSRVTAEPLKCEDGKTEVLGATSARGVFARIITSPFKVGLTAGVLEETRNVILGIWDE